MRPHDSDISYSPTRMLRSWKFLLPLAFVLSLMLSDHASAQENWSRFHGANGSGLALDADLPSQISDENFIWNVELAGTGSSSPVVWGDRVFVNSTCLLYTSPSPRDATLSRMPSSA